MSILVRQVSLKNYKSIASCRVALRDVTLLVGPNGSGKSNFIDALRLVSDALASTLEYAIRQRGGIGEVRRRSGGHPTHFTISLRLALGDRRNASYSVQIGAKPEGAFTIQRESASISGSGLDRAYFEMTDGVLTDTSAELRSIQPKATDDRLFLTAVSGILPFRELFDGLSGVRSYAIDPERIKEPQPHDSGERLDRNGWNLAAVIKRLGEDPGSTLPRIQDYLRQIVPGIEEVLHRTYGPRETLEFKQAVPGQKHAWRFHAANMSDGTLRSLGVLTALLHPVSTDPRTPPLIAIEEPEITIHPGAAAVIMDALFEAARTRQVLATTHSPDLLDHPHIDADSILAVRNVGGETQISAIDDAAKSAIRDSLYTPGELMRQGQLAWSDDANGRRVRESAEAGGAE